MSKIKQSFVILAFLASLLLPNLQVAVGTSLADLDISPAPVWACENPQPFGGC